MAYEASEIMTAVALQSDMSTLDKVKNPTDLQKLINNGKKIVKAKKDIQFGDEKTFQGFSAKLTDKFIKDMAVGVSAAKGIRRYMNKASGKLTVYMTGNIFPKDVEAFKVSAFGFEDYNSSDIIVSADKKKFFGVSLKKKKDVKAADPTLINKAFSSVFEGKKYDKLKQEILDLRIKYFSGLVRKAVKKKIILEKDINNFKRLSDKELFESKGIDKKQFGDKGYIDTKGYASSKKGYLDENTKDPKSMRFFVNRDLSDKKNPLWSKYREVVNKYSNELADTLLNIILKTKLFEQLDAKKIKGKEFDFALITGIGDVTPKGEVKILPASIKALRTTLCGLTRIEKKAKNDKFAVIVNEDKSAKSDAAKIFLTLVRGRSKILNLEVRYKGKFTPRPQFQGGLAKDFETIMKAECGSA